MKFCHSTYMYYIYMCIYTCSVYIYIYIYIYIYLYIYIYRGCFLLQVQLGAESGNSVPAIPGSP